MTAKKRKKKSRQRGSWTHGWGAKKKHRGSGHKGGKGMAGTGKRADCKKPRVWKDVYYFGKFGFKKKGIIAEVCPINIEDIEKLITDGKIKREGTIDLGALGYNKLLGKGLLRDKLKIIVESASENAVAKISEKGGEVIIKKEEQEASE